MNRKILRMEAPIDLACPSCGCVGVTLRIVFPIDYAVEGHEVAFLSPDVKVPVQLQCNGCAAYVNYGPVGELGEGNLFAYASREEAFYADAAEAGSEDSEAG
jgi:hypothetical protein